MKTYECTQELIRKVIFVDVQQVKVNLFVTMRKMDGPIGLGREYISCL